MTRRQGEVVNDDPFENLLAGAYITQGKRRLEGRRHPWRCLGSLGGT